MGTPVPALGVELFRGLRATAYDLPEDFLQRIDPGLTEENRNRLARGVETLRLLRRIHTWILYALLAGAAITIGGWLILAVLRSIDAGSWLIDVVFAGAWLVAGVLLVIDVGISVARRSDLRSVLAFWRAMQGSSLARDIA